MVKYEAKLNLEEWHDWYITNVNEKYHGPNVKGNTNYWVNVIGQKTEKDGVFVHARSNDIDAWLPKEFIESWETSEVYNLVNSDENLYKEAYRLATKKQTLRQRAFNLYNFVYNETNIWQELKQQDKTAKKSAIDWLKVVQCLGEE